MESAKPVILFVDDEKGVLDGLRRSLYALRNEWDMIFAVGGFEALAVAENQKVDVVVSDMRMPGMDGAALLDRIRIIQPAAARIVLSGFSEREAIFRTLGPAHQYFVKPCPPQTLVEAIRRSLAVRRALHDESLLALVGGARSIPALPETLSTLIRELQSPEGSATEVARIIASDVGLTANLLKLTNSGFFFLPSSVTDVFQAVKLLGFETLRALAVLAGLFDAISTPGVTNDTLSRLERRSLHIGALARRIGEAEGLSRSAADQAQCAGMLSHVGSLLLFSRQPEAMLAIGRELDASGGDVVVSERRALGASHAEVGGVLLGLWGFTDPVVEAVLFHHEPSRSQIHGSSAKSPLTAVHAAQHLVRPVPAGADPHQAWTSGLDTEFLEVCGCGSKIASWAAIAAGLAMEER